MVQILQIGFKEVDPNYQIDDKSDLEKLELVAEGYKNINGHEIYHTVSDLIAVLMSIISMRISQRSVT